MNTLAAPGKVDYHIHYHIDGCANDEMTLANIDHEAKNLNLEEVCVLKHFSKQLPNGEDKWTNWKRIIPVQFDDFLKDIRAFHSQYGIKFFAGVETEILNDTGEINVTKEAMEKLDVVSLSVHWLPDMKVLKFNPMLWPANIEKLSIEEANHWRTMIKETGPAVIVENLVKAYIQALKCNPKVNILAHMHDGLFPLREFEIPVDNLTDSKIVENFEPLLKICAEKQVLWEITDLPVKRESVVKRACEMGVKFTATTDVHCLDIFREHYRAEENIEFLGLTKGLLR